MPLSMLQSSDMDRYILNHLKTFFLDPEMQNTNFLVGVERQEFKCNGSVLAVISPVLRDLLFCETKHRKNYAQKGCARVELTNITPKGFAALVRYAFSLDPEISPENVIEVIHAAKECKVEIIHKLALQYLTSVLEAHPDKILVTYFEKATLFGLPRVFSACMKRFDFLGGVEEFLRSNKFTKYSAEFVSCLLNFDELAAEEEVVWECILNWAKVQANKNDETLLEMLKLVYKKVRFPLMTMKYFSSEVVPTRVLTNKEMVDLFCWLTNPEEKPETISFSFTPRLLWDNVLINRSKECLKRVRGIPGEESVSRVGLMVDRKCQLLAVGSFVGAGCSKSRVSIFKVAGKVMQLLRNNNEVEIWRKETLAKPAKIDLQEPVLLDAGEDYVIEVDQTGPVATRMKSSESVVLMNHNNLEITFRWTKLQKKGNIPCIWVSALSGR